MRARALLPVAMGLLGACGPEGPDLEILDVRRIGSSALMVGDLIELDVDARNNGAAPATVSAAVLGPPDRGFLIRGPAREIRPGRTVTLRVELLVAPPNLRACAVATAVFLASTGEPPTEPATVASAMWNDANPGNHTRDVRFEVVRPIPVSLEVVGGQLVEVEDGRSASQITTHLTADAILTPDDAYWSVRGVAVQMLDSADMPITSISGRLASGRIESDATRWTPPNSPQRTGIRRATIAIEFQHCDGRGDRLLEERVLVQLLK